VQEGTESCGVHPDNGVYATAAATTTTTSSSSSAAAAAAASWSE
jgi:hypothetical protein